MKVHVHHMQYQIDGLMQERRNPSALAIELHLSCANPSKSEQLLYLSCKLYMYKRALSWCWMNMLTHWPWEIWIKF